MIANCVRVRGDLKIAPNNGSGCNAKKYPDEKWAKLLIARQYNQAGIVLCFVCVGIFRN